MHVVRVIPIAKGVGREAFSYFSVKDIDPGDLVTIPLRLKNVQAIVIEKTPAHESKQEIRTADFQLKKIEHRSARHLLLQGFMEAVHASARYFATTSGILLHALLSKNIFEEGIIGSRKNASSAPITRDLSLTSPGIFVLQGGEEERFSHYRSLIREEFAAKKSVLLIVPTIEEAEYATRLLEKGIEGYTLTIHSGVSKKEFQKGWNAAARDSHPLLMIGTGLLFAFPRRDIGTIIVNHESSRAYTMPARPFLDIRTFAEAMAKYSGARLIFGDTMLRIETLYRHQTGEFTELSPFTYRALSPAKQTIIDMRARARDIHPKKPFAVFSPELIEHIQKTKERHERLFLFTARRGLFPLTLCGDCGSVVLCAYCTAPVILQTADASTVFVCNKCGAKRTAEERCKICTSWKLVPLGIGIELVEKQVQELCPDLPLFLVDQNHASTRKRRNALVEKFMQTPGGILLGTEVALSHLHTSIDTVAVVSIDSLFSIPDFRMHEKIINLLLALRSLASGTFLIQTRNIGEHILHGAIAGNVLDFYRKEMAERNRFSFPPASTLIKISRSGERDALAKDMTWLAEHLADYEPQIFPAFTPMIKGKHMMHALIKVPYRQWVDEKLLQKLYALPPHFVINVDPESIL